MRNVARKVLVGASVLGGIASLLKGLKWLRDAIGTAETASGVVEKRGAIMNWFAAIPQYAPLALFLLGVFGLLCLKFGSPALWFAKLFAKSPVPQPIFIAIDQLKGWLYQGQALENRFQFPEKAKPSFGECVAWDENATACARQQVFADIIRPSDMARFRERWNEQACRKAEAKLDEYGCLEAVNDTGRSVYRYIFGRVRRLEELLAHIESTPQLVIPPIQDSVLHWPVVGASHHEPYDNISALIFGTPEMRQQREAQVEALVNRSLAMLRADPKMLPLYALQIEGAGSLESNAQFLDACERLHQRHIPHPLKQFKDIKVDWLEVVRFANREEMGFSSDAAVYDCLKLFSSANSTPAVAQGGDDPGVKSETVAAFRIAALPPIPDLENLTQNAWHKSGKSVFTGDAVVTITNLLASQGIDRVSFRVLSITPPFVSPRSYKPPTQHAVIKRIEFEDDIPDNTTLAPGKTLDVRLFKATRPPAAQSLGEIAVVFYGKWPAGHPKGFRPIGKHILLLEVTGSGVGPVEETIEVLFSASQAEPVFAITKRPP
jgi:hypothetical protein